MAKKDVASFPRADTDIIKSEDMITALPVPRSSSEVIKPSELFLDLMMLDPLKTKEVSETAKPSTAPRAEASPKHLPPASAPPVTQPAIASALPAAQGPSLASQMVANATAATASMPFCQAAPFYSIPEGPRISPAPVAPGGYGYTMVVNGREFSMRPQYNVVPVQMSHSTQLPPAQRSSKALGATTSSSSHPCVLGAVADGAAGVQSVNQTKSLPSRTYTTQVVVTPPAQASMALPVRSPATSCRITGIQGRPSQPSQPSQPGWTAPGAFSVARIATAATNAAYPLQTTVAPRPTVSMLLPARGTAQPAQPAQPWPLRPVATAPQPWPMAMPFDGRTVMPLATPQRFGIYPSPGAIVMPPVRSPSNSMAQTVAMNAQARFPLPS